MKHWYVSLCLFLSPWLIGAVDPVQFESELLKERYEEVTQTLRCPKCQNQSIAGSDAPIAKDMRKKVEEQVQAGMTNEEIEQFMIQRYGDFVTYKPPLRARTYVLWFGPPIFLILVGWWFWMALFRKKRNKGPHPSKEAV